MAGLSGALSEALTDVTCLLSHEVDKVQAPLRCTERRLLGSRFAAGYDLDEAQS